MPARVARYGARDVDAAARRTPASCAIAARSSRRSTTPAALLELRDEFGSLAAYAWSWEPGPPDRPAAVTWAALRAMPTTADVGGAVEGPQEARLDVCRTDDHLRVHAGDGPGERPPRRLLRARRGRARRGGAAGQRPGRRGDLHLFEGEAGGAEQGHQPVGSEQVGAADDDEARRRARPRTRDLGHPVAVAVDEQALVDLRRLAERLQQQAFERRRRRRSARP